MCLAAAELAFAGQKAHDAISVVSAYPAADIVDPTEGVCLAVIGQLGAPTLRRVDYQRAVTAIAVVFN